MVIVSGKGRALRAAGLVAILVVAIVTLRSKLPDPADIGTALTTARPWFLVLALAAEAASLRHFALQQRRLLAGFGVGMSLPRALAVTVSRSAMSASLPAGSAVSAAYAFRQFRTAGASRRAATNVTVLSGLLSGVALVLVYLLALLLPHTGASTPTQTAVVVLTTLGVAMVVFGVDKLMSRRVYVPVEPDEDGDSAGTGVITRLVSTAHRAVAQLGQLPPRTWTLSLLHAAVNWATDFACLAAVAAAFHVNVSLTGLATVYLTVQLVRQIPLSPGGIGVIEVALLAGLVSAGSGQAAAAAVVLVYRLLSCWLIIPIGGLAYAVLQRRTAPVVPVSPAPVAGSSLSISG